MPIKWSYALNQWKPFVEFFTLPVHHERALKTAAVCGFTGVEFTAGSGRWEPLGCAASMTSCYGSVEKFRQVMRACGIDGASSLFIDPAYPLVDLAYPGASPAKKEDAATIVSVLRQFAAFLGELGGSRLVVRAAPSFWRLPNISADAIATIADCWNAVAAASAEYQITVGLHVDCLSAVRTMDDIGRLLDLTDPETVGLAVDTAELTIAGLDPLAVYERFHNRVVHFHFKDARETDELGEFASPNADAAFLRAGGRREIDRWFWEMGVPRGLVDFPALMRALKSHAYDGWIVVESDHTPAPAGSVMLNSWYVHNVLAPIVS